MANSTDATTALAIADTETRTANMSNLRLEGGIAEAVSRAVQDQ
jgi:hypothetical protein